MNSGGSLNLNTTIGAFQLGVLVSYVLFGVTTTQTYLYYSRFPDDSLKLKALVAFVWVCEFVNTLCIGYTLYVWTISDYSHPERLLSATPSSLAVAVFVTGIIAAFVPGFFSFRIYRLSKKLAVPVITWIMAFLRLLGGIVLFIATLKMKSVEGYVTQWEWLLTFIWAVGSANDLTITATLVFLLHKQRDKAHKRTAVLVDKLILWTIETGLLTSITGLVELACFVTMKDNFIWIAFFAVVTRLYSNSLLARESLRAMSDAHLSISLAPPTSAIQFPSGNAQLDKSARIIRNTVPRNNVVFENV
ncbi:hypothetical protein K438DRAFT_1839055 [Mycena galopus ATCC 62051]|nr:hypothetical protein K438DRAFT_1839055 [Mycena galopus ATCC 62051]